MVNPKKNSGNKPRGSGPKLYRHREVCRALGRQGWPFLLEKAAKSPVISAAHRWWDTEPQTQTAASLCSLTTSISAAAPPLHPLPSRCPKHCFGSPSFAPGGAAGCSHQARSAHGPWWKRAISPESSPAFISCDRDVAGKAQHFRAACWEESLTRSVITHANSLTNMQIPLLTDR